MIKPRPSRAPSLLNTLLLGLALFVLGCAGTSRTQLLEAHVSSHVYHHPQADVVSAATSMLTEMGFRVFPFDGSVLRTNWHGLLDDEEFATAYDRYVIQIKHLSPQHCRVQAVKLSYASVGMETYHPQSQYKPDGNRNVNNVTNGKGVVGLPMGKPSYTRDFDFEWRLLRRVEPERARLLEGTVDSEAKRAGR
ncbi:MAG: hypothetical protein U0359_09220 [Byssovorax sp.]